MPQRTAAQELLRDRAADAVANVSPARSRFRSTHAGVRAMRRQGIWILPPPGSVPPGASVAPAGGSTIDDDAWRRNS